MNHEQYFSLLPEIVRQMDKSAFLVAGADPINPMTIGWAEFGWVWGRPVATVMVRKSRFTYGLMEQADHFTVCVPAPDTFVKELAYCGSRSGRDGDKLAKAGLSAIPAKSYAGEVVGNCGIYVECKKVLRAETDLAQMDPSIRAKFYGANQAGGNGDPHVLYFGEVTEAYRG